MLKTCAPEVSSVDTTVTPLSVHMIDLWEKTTKNNNGALAVSLDISKGLDRVWSGSIIGKLSSCG